MSFDSLLIQTCSILSNDNDTADGYGQKTRQIASWDVVASSVPCRLSTSGVDRAREKKGEQKTGTDFRKVFMRNPTLSNGQTLNRHHAIKIGSDYYNVRDVLPLRDSTSLHHVEAIVEQVIG